MQRPLEVNIASLIGRYLSNYYVEHFGFGIYSCIKNKHPCFSSGCAMFSLLFYKCIFAPSDINYSSQ